MGSNFWDRQQSMSKTTCAMLADHEYYCTKVVICRRNDSALAVLPLCGTVVTFLQERLASKRDDLAQKHEDARLLRADIDERSRSIVNMLHQTLSPAEFSDYEYYILMKSQLAVELQDVEHAIQLGDRQLHLLHSSASALSMPSSDC